MGPLFFAGFRARASGLKPEGRVSAYTRRPMFLKRMVGARGFEPPASWSRTRRASQAALRPDCKHSGAETLARMEDPE